MSQVDVFFSTGVENDPKPDVLLSVCTLALGDAHLLECSLRRLLEERSKEASIEAPRRVGIVLKRLPYSEVWPAFVSFEGFPLDHCRDRFV